MSSEKLLKKKEGKNIQGGEEVEDESSDSDVESASETTRPIKEAIPAILNIQHAKLTEKDVREKFSRKH